MRFFLSLLLLCFPILGFTFTVIDDDGQVLQFTKPAQRVISLAPDITEILYAIKANNKLVAVIAGSDYPRAALQLPMVGNYLGLDLERILFIHPDVIITWGDNFARQLSMLKNHGIKVYVNRPTQLVDVAHSMENFGKMMGNAQIAQEVASQYRQQLQMLTDKYHQQKPVRVFYQLGDSLFTINQDSWIHQVITLCGGINIFANAKLIAPEIDMEAIVNRDPDVIISGNSNNQWQNRWLRWSQMRAVANHALFTIDSDLIERAGPRLVIGSTKFCQILQQYRDKA